MAPRRTEYLLVGLRRIGRRAAVLSVLLGLMIGAGDGWANPDSLCATAARRAAEKSGVPENVMMAVSLTETGRKHEGNFQAWPWTVNMEGKGLWFDDAQSAQAYVQHHFGAGARSFDVGCFQINYRWHGRAFDSVADMFDPQRNADYAARFLSDLYRETGDWSKAAGAYHSRTEKYAKIYRARFDRHLSRLVKTPPAAPQEPRRFAQASPNAFPFLRAGRDPAGLGSLVPLNGDARPSLFDLSAGG